MNKPDLLRQIADAAYNVGFGAKKHFATYDLVEKSPGWIGIISIAVGIFALLIDALATKVVSAGFLVLGLTTFYIGSYNESKNEYEEKGKLLTKLFDELKALYFRIKTLEKEDFSNEAEALYSIQSRYHDATISKQVFLSDWYAHYKFFWQHQIEWIDEQKHFRFWRDKLPLSFLLFLLSCFAGIALFLFSLYFQCKGGI